MNIGFRLTCCICILLLLGGCWDYQELNQVAIVTGIAIDKGEKNKFKLTVEILNSLELNPQQASGNAASVIYSLEGDSIPDISRRMNLGLSRRMFFSHMRTAVISEKVAKEGILDFFDYLERYREIREDFNVTIAKGAKAADILKTSFPVQRVSTLKLHTQLDNAVHEWGADPDIRKKDIISSWTSFGRQPVTAVVSISGSPKKGNNVDNMKYLQPQSIVELLGMGVFKDEKLIGVLSIKDTRNYLWTQNKLKLTTLTIPCQKNKKITFRVFRTDTVVKAKYKGDTPEVNINIDAETQLDGTQCKLVLDKIKTYQTLERKIEKEIQKEVAQTIEKVQKKYKVDVFGFGEDMNRQDYRHFKKVENKWDKEFSRAIIHVNPHVTLRRTGIRTTSFLSEIK